MKIVIDATFNPHGGSLVHLKEFILNLKNRVSPGNLVIYIKKENISLIGTETLKGCDIKIATLPSVNRFFWILWLQFVLPFKIMLLKYDILFSPGNISPILKTTKIKAQWVATIGPFYKMVYLGLNFKDRMLLHLNKLLMLFSMMSSNMVIHESKYSLDLFTSKYKLKKDQQYLIECGKSNFFYHDLDKDKVSNKSILEIQPEDLLCVSHFYPYKNLERMVLAFDAFLKKSDTKNVKLLMCGLPTFKSYYFDIVSLTKQLKYPDNIVFVGGVDQVDLRYAYSRCKFMIFPSLCESSGYTLIEAMSCGTALIATKLTAIPYTCEDAALYFDAFDVNDLCQKMQILNSDVTLQTELRKKSIERKDSLLNFNESADLFHKYLSQLI